MARTTKEKRAQARLNALRADLAPVRAFDKAEQLLAALSPTEANWGLRPNMWAFRGHGDTRWKLIPSAHRRDSWTPFGMKGFDPATALPFMMAHVEATVLLRFLIACDKCGLSIPYDVRNGFRFRQGQWPPKKLHTALALAQHRGIPTRLLDWTRRARHAAYFAATAALQQARLPKFLEVWALDLAILEQAAGIKPPMVDAVTAPAFSNTLLHAQAGIFTLCHGYQAPLDDVIIGHFAALQSRGQAIPAEVFRRYALPGSQAKRLLRILHHDGVDGYSLFPSYEGAAKGVREQILWEGFDLRSVDSTGAIR